jgi:hypothetical protein
LALIGIKRSFLRLQLFFFQELAANYHRFALVLGPFSAIAVFFLPAWPGGRGAAR